MSVRFTSSDSTGDYINRYTNNIAVFSYCINCSFHDKGVVAFGKAGLKTNNFAGFLYINLSPAL